MQEVITTTTLVAVVHNNQIGGGVNLGRVLKDGDWIALQRGGGGND
jgi:hypothetical protein